MTEQIIAGALFRVLSVYTDNSGGQDTRAFFRLDGFDDQVYRRLCDLFKHSQDLQGRPVVVRSTSPLGPGYEQFELEPGRTATAYRNNVLEGQTLVLIFNKVTSDRQSLSNLFLVNESLLARQHLDLLIEATFKPSRVSHGDFVMLRKFVETLCVIREPQLRSLVVFLTRVKEAILRTEEMHAAIGQALPAIQLFRSTQVASILGQGKSVAAIIRKINAAANHTLQSIESKDVDKHLDKLDGILFENNHAAKRAALEDYLRGIDTKSALEIDWAEIEPLLSGRRSGSSRSKRAAFQSQLMQLGTDLQDVLQKDDTLAILENNHKDVIDSLLEGQAPDLIDIEGLIDVYGSQIGNKLAKRVSTVLDIGKPARTEDFPLGLTSLVIKMISKLAHIPAGIRVLVRLLSSDPSAQAASAFQTLYGGLPNLLFSIAEWDIDTLTQIAAAELDHEDEPEDKPHLLLFEVVILSSGERLDRHELEWQYKPGGPLSDLVQVVRTLRGGISRGQAPIPIFSCDTNGKTPDVAVLSRSLGSWWGTPFKSMSTQWKAVLAKHRGFSPIGSEQVAQAMGVLEGSFAQFLESSTQGILWQIEPLLHSYKSLLDTVGKELNTEVEIKLATDLINRAWTIASPANEWLVVPLFHPMKLLWFLNRVRHFNTLLDRLLTPGGPPAVADSGWLQRDIALRFSSAYFPAVIIYGDLDTESHVFLPSEEANGVELFRPSESSQGYVATAGDQDAPDRATLKNAAEQVVNALESYIEAYPFASSGVKILLANVQSPALAIEILRKVMPRRIALTLTVHSTGQTSLLYAALNTWVDQNEEMRDRSEGSYFPNIQVVVQEGNLADLIAKPPRYDMVVLVDALSEAGQEVAFRQTEALTPEPLEQFVPFFQALMDPFAHGATRREMALTPPKLPALVRQFYGSQAANLSPHNKPLTNPGAIEFKRILKLGNWPQTLKHLHERAVWVLCYDINADRFLLNQTVDKEHLHIIRYVLGLGPKKQHNLTVSSSFRSREDVVRRMTQRLESLLSDFQPGFRQKLGRSLVDRAQKLSGSVVLRAAGPGTMLNELLGLVMAKRRVEERLRSSWPECLVTWVYLDDYPDWFRTGKRPDMLAVATRRAADGGLELHLCVVEAKCVTSAAVDREYSDALMQVHKGTEHLLRTFAPGKPYIDSEHWYTQLYQAIVSNLEFSNDQEDQVVALRAILEGSYDLKMIGEAWVFGYDSSSFSGSSDIETDMGKSEYVWGFRVNSRGVRQTLAQVLRETGTNAIELPEEFAPYPRNTPKAVPSTPIHQATDEPPDVSPRLDNNRDPLAYRSVAREVAAGQDYLLMDGSIEQPNDEQIVTPISEIPIVPPLNNNPLELLLDYDTRGDEATAEEYAQDCLDRTIRFLKGFDQLVKPAGYQIGPRVIRLKVGITLNRTSSFKNVTARKTDLRLQLRLESEPNFQAGNDGTIWIDIPRPQPSTVGLKALLKAVSPSKAKPETRFPLGLQMDGSPYIADLRKIPHWLVGGTSGSGKSVFLRSVLLSLMLTNSPETLRLVIVDPKGDLVAFRNSPYTSDYVHTRINLAQKAVQVLKSVKHQMDERLDLMVNKHMVNEIDDFHRIEGKISLPRVVVLIEEYGDLVSNDEFSKELAGLVEQIAAIGRAPGIHLFVCTQNPVVKTVSTDIKANCAGRVALWVKTQVNSQVILDEPGAEDLLKNGDMLFKSDGPTVRIQAPFVDNLTELQPVLQSLANRFGTQNEET